MQVVAAADFHPHRVARQNGRDAVQAWARAGEAGAGVTRQVQRGQRYPMSITDYKRRGGTVATGIVVLVVVVTALVTVLTGRGAMHAAGHADWMLPVLYSSRTLAAGRQR